MPVARTVNADEQRVAELLGRHPAGRYEVVVRDDAGDPVVICNAPLLDDGTPMPTRYWLIGRDEVVAVSRLEARGGVRAAEASVDAAELAAAHDRYAAERDADLPSTAQHRPTGGVGGTRQGVKCLHAHYAWHLAGGDDPVGRWVAAELSSALTIDVGASIVVRHGIAAATLPTSLNDLVTELTEADPPKPQSLTNAIGAISDDIDNLLRQQPQIAEQAALVVTGEEAWHLAVVERGRQPDVDVTRLAVTRDDLEDLFRTLATEPRSERVHNPALQTDHVDTVLATCCAVLATMRRLQFRSASVPRPTPAVH